VNGHLDVVNHVEHVMGMAVSFDIRAPMPPGDALQAVVEWLHHVDETFSTYKENSEISRFARGEISVDDLAGDTADVLQMCMELTDITNGAFDAFVVPAPNGTSLDPSGYVKGWAVERAAAMLQSAGAENFCINAGGDIALRGTAGTDQPWRVGIRHPAMPHQQAIVIDVAGPVSIATSATYERGAHIIDPRDGQPTTGVASATVVGPDLGIADAFATALFVMGEDGLDWIEQQPGYEGYIIANDEITMWTSGFPHDGRPPAR
jgi:thiamine biosynthesis lipoprotein